MFSRITSVTKAAQIEKGVALAQVARTSTSAPKSSRWWKAAGVVGGVALALGVAAASDDAVPPIALPWSHGGYVSGAYDTASIRRGYEVYRNVCSTCHSMSALRFRDLIGVSHTEVQAKALAESFTMMDGPDEKGNMFERPGRLTDNFPSPYPNEEAARAANGGAIPPDLSCIIKGRPGNEDYVFSLLNGYREPPAGIEMRPGLHYNAYFSGGAIAMAKPLNDEGVEYEDGTPATESQMAKDVVTFLAWASRPEADERKKSGVKMIAMLSVMAALAAFNKRRVWNVLKSRKIFYRPTKPYASNPTHH